MNRRRFLAGLGLASAAAAVTLPIARDTAPDISEPAPKTAGSGPRADYFPNYEVHDHQGRTLRFYDDVIAGKVVLVNFTYVNCQGSCPAAVMNLKKVYKELGDRVGRDIHMISLTIKPAEDTPEKLAEYVKTHRIGPGWTFLTGKPEEIEVLRRKLGFYSTDPAEDVLKNTHIGIVRIGNEKLDRWTASPILQSPHAIVRTLAAVQPRGLTA
jgi:protein SCO1/2